MVTSANTDWLSRAQAIAGSSLGSNRFPAEIDLVIERGAGARVWDTNGREYIDFLLGSGPLVLGHAHPAIVAAVQAQLPFGSTYYALNKHAIMLAEEIIAASPCAERVRYVSTGAESTAYAIRLARAVTNRSKILKFEGAYHGSHDAAMMSFSPSGPPSWPEAQPDSAGIPEGVRKDILIAPYNDDEYTEVIARDHAGDLAAIIVEPLQRTIPLTPGFLSTLRDIADQLGAVLIFDEVVTGFRLAYGGAQEFYGVTPDIATFGKILAGGFPLAAIAGRSDILDLADPFKKGHPNFVPISGTLSGNPISATAGLATLAELRQPGVYERLSEAGQFLRQGLADVGARYGVPLQVVGEGPLAAVHFTNNTITSYRDVLGADHGLMARVNISLIKRGILVNLGSKFYISLVHTDQDLETCIEAFDAAVSEASQS